MLVVDHVIYRQYWIRTNSVCNMFTLYEVVTRIIRGRSLYGGKRHSVVTLWAHDVACPVRKFWDRCCGWYELRFPLADVVCGRRLTAMALHEVHNACRNSDNRFGERQESVSNLGRDDRFSSSKRAARLWWPTQPSIQRVLVDVFQGAKWLGCQAGNALMSSTEVNHE
jgi:hypothetical protein